MVWRWCVGMVVVLTLPGVAPAQPPKDLKQLQKELEKLQADFLKDKEKAKNDVGKKLDGLIVSVKKKPGLTGAERSSLVDKWAEEKDRFLKSDEISEQTDHPKIWLDYGMVIQKKYKPVSSKADEAIKAAQAKNDDKTAGELREAKQGFEYQHFPGRRTFTQGVVWTGSLYEGKNAITFRLNVQELKGDVFKGRVAQNLNTANHPIHEVRGSIDGPYIKCAITGVVNGNAKVARYEGIVLGKTIILSSVRVGAKGAQIAGHVILRR